MKIKKGLFSFEIEGTINELADLEKFSSFTNYLAQVIFKGFGAKRKKGKKK